MDRMDDVDMMDETRRQSGVTTTREASKGMARACFAMTPLSTSGQTWPPSIFLRNEPTVFCPDFLCN